LELSGEWFESIIPDMEKVDIESIRVKYSHYETVKPNTAVADIRTLLKEIDRLESELYELEETYR
jgi:hypothetical protein